MTPLRHTRGHVITWVEVQGTVQYTRPLSWPNDTHGLNLRGGGGMTLGIVEVMVVVVVEAAAAVVVVVVEAVVDCSVNAPLLVLAKQVNKRLSQRLILLPGNTAVSATPTRHSTAPQHHHSAPYKTLPPVTQSPAVALGRRQIERKSAGGKSSFCLLLTDVRQRHFRATGSFYCFAQ